MPAGELANIDVSARVVLGPMADELYERIREAGTWPERFAVLDELLLQGWSRGERSHRRSRAPGPPAVLGWRRCQ